MEDEASVAAAIDAGLNSVLPFTLVAWGEQHVDAGLATALAFVLYFTLLKRLGSVGTTAQAYLRVPIGVGIGIVALGETPQSTAYTGLALVVASVIAMTVPVRGRVQTA